jgi:hypothetical protein
VVDLTFGLANAAAADAAGVVVTVIIGDDPANVRVLCTASPADRLDVSGRSTTVTILSD